MTQLSSDSKSNIELVRRLSLECYPLNRILADLTFVQAILEAGLRKSHPSQLALKYNNLFGIKGNGTNGYVLLPTKEYTSGGWVEVDARFARNNNVEDSLQQHKEFLEHTRYKNLADAKTFEEAATLIRKDGYATDPKYTLELMELYYEYVKDE